MYISIIIPTLNRISILEKLLISISNQTLPRDKFEVLVVDNNSTDKTKTIVSDFSKRMKNLRYFLELKPGLHEGRHQGWKRAKGEILVFADDDIEAFPTWLEGISQAFEDKEAVLVGGNNLPKFEIKPPLWLSRMWKSQPIGKRSIGELSIIDHGDKIKKIDSYGVFGCNYAIRKNILEECKGFHPDSMPNEIIKFRGDGESYVSNYIRNNQLKTIFSPKASVYHFVTKERMTYEYFYQRSFNQGISHSFTDTRIINKPLSSLKLEVKFYQNYFQKKLNCLLSKQSLKQSLQDIIESGLFDGYYYHQKEIRKDPELLKWVLRDNYL